MRNPYVIGAHARYGDGGVVVNPLQPVLGLVGVNTNVVEGGTVSFSVTRVGNLQVACQVTWTVSAPSGAGVKSVPGDWPGGVFPSGTAAFAAGSPGPVQVAIVTVDDVAILGDRNYLVTLSNPTANGVVDPNARTVLGTLRENDVGTGPLIGIDAINVSLIEGDTLQFNVTRGGDAAPACGVSWAVSGTGATPSVAADWTGGVFPSGTASFAAGSTAPVAVSKVTVVRAGTQGNRDFLITLSGATGGAVIDPNTSPSAGTVGETAVGGGTAWGSWAKRGQNTGLTWQTGAGDSGAPVNGSMSAAEQHWAGRFTKSTNHTDIYTSFLTHATVSGMTSSIQGKKTDLTNLAKANVRVCQTFHMISDADSATAAKFDAVLTGNMNATYVTHWRAFAQVLKDAGCKSPVVRMGHEMNGSFPSGRQGSARYISLYKKARAAIKAVYPEIVCCWNPLRGQTKTEWWPGDDVVDIVGVDWYNNGGVPGTSTGYINTQADWDAAYMKGTVDEPLGWGQWIAFARKHGKMLSVCEWGEGYGSGSSPSDSNQDAPGYVALFKKFCVDQRAAGMFMFDTYFNNASHQIDPHPAAYVPNFETRYFSDWVS